MHIELWSCDSLAVVKEFASNTFFMVDVMLDRSGSFSMQSVSMSSHVC